MQYFRTVAFALGASQALALSTATLLAADATTVARSEAPKSPATTATMSAGKPAASTPAQASEEPVVAMDKFVILADKPMEMDNAIDRKIYNLGNDLLAQTGTASEVLQNIPSLSVDIEGNVSLRGSESVMILIDGKTSPLMGANRAAVLQQLPASEIERIEVITNPSAKYKPDGTSGIINIVMKKNRVGRTAGGTVNATMGSDDRYSTGLMVTTNVGRWGFFGSYSYRLDDRLRFTEDNRLRTDAFAGSPVRFHQRTEEGSRPGSHILRAGAEYTLDRNNRFDFSGNYNWRRYDRHELFSTRVEDLSGNVLSDYDRLRTGYESESGSSISGKYVHQFAKPGHEFSIEFKSDREVEDQANRFRNRFRTPAAMDSFDNTLTDETSTDREFTADYSNDFGNDMKMEVGYEWRANKRDMNFTSEAYDIAAQRWVTDFGRSNHFIYSDDIHAVYTTFEQTLGAFGYLAGVRAEQTYVDSELVNTGVTIPNDYFRVYPSLHFSYKVNEAHGFQTSYSHRVHRPHGDDLNPFPVYRDPYNLRIGNPHLKPEDIHSIEVGHMWKFREVSLVSTLYHRYLYNGVTDITEYIDANTQRSTKTNLSTSKSSGVEFALSGRPAKWVSVNASFNGFRNRIDVSNLGLGADRSITTWNAKISSSFTLSKKMMLQCSANYSARRLTSQGYRLPSWVMNVGLRRELIEKKAFVVLTVSDLFDSMKEKNEINTPLLQETVTRRKSPRIFYLGFTYNFGHQKKTKDAEIKFDEGS